jgi:ribonuclease G
VSGPEKATGGQEPAATPVEATASKPDESATQNAAGTTTGAGAAPSGAPRRRRGNRGGRRRRKPAADVAAGAESPSAGADARPGGRPSPSPTPPASSSDALPTAPLIPVAAPRGGARVAPRPERPEPQGAPHREAEAVAGPEPAKQPPRPARRRGRKPGASGATVETPVPAEPVASSPPGVPDDAVAADGAPAKRRRRGTRGGRRRHKASDIQHAEAAREAEEAVGEVAGGTDMAAEPLAERAVEPPAEPAPAEAAAADATGADGAEGTAKRRRRGARGGSRRGRERSGGDEAAAASSSAAPVVEAAPSSAAEKTPTGKASREVKARGRDHRRPKAIVRQDEGSGLGTAVSTLPPRRTTVVAEQPARKLILVSDDGHELRVALVEDGRLAEIYIERPEKKSYLGDIYQGKVESVMGGIDAAFVDFGLEKNGFLYVDEVTTPEGEKRARRIGDALKNGQQVMVQVTKDPMGSKGARLSTKVSLAGRYLVYVPGGSGVGISRRLGQSERDRLRDISKELKPKNAGLIVRTIAEGHGLEDLKRDLRYLSRLWSRLKKKAETVKAPGLVHKEVDISIEVARDLFNDTCESLVVDDPKRHKAIVGFLDKEAPELLPKVHQHTGEAPLFEAYGIEEQIAQALERRVPLPSGGNMVIDHAEALTVIDVNTGRFTRGKGLEDTITKTNLEAAREVVRQLRLRDIGGIIVIDFIDMAHAKNREMVLATLEAELETDRTKTYVVELSPLGLVEMTRQNTTDGARGILTKTCPTCLGKARVLSEESMALRVERRVRALARTSQAKAWLIEVSAGVAERLTSERLKQLEKQVGRRVFLEGGGGLPVDTFRVLAEGTPAHVQEQRIPVREGQEVEIELEFSLTYSPRDAVGYIDGYMVIVEGGRPHLGTKRKVRIAATARTGAYATVAKQKAN